jgi:short-subunit dehydrogenase
LHPREFILCANAASYLEPMSIKLKNLEEQVIVITGASSGIGLATARLAAERGAKLVLAARSQNALKKIADSLSTEAVAVVCDVSNRYDVEHLANAAIENFNRIDTWINNAGVSIYGRLEEVSEVDSRRLFDTNFWGVYHGSLVALRHLRQGGGALINVGSEVSEAVIPLQGIYSASKHAVKGFTDALRIEVEEIDEAPVSITLIQPTAVDTPYPQHAKNYMAMEPKLPTPMISAEKVAEAILNAAENPVRATKVGAMAKINTAVAKTFPSLGDKMSAMQNDRQQYDEKPRNPEGALFHPSETTGVIGQTYGTGGRPH